MVLQPGDFAENITTQGLNLPVLPIGTRLQVGSTVLMEVTQIGKTCHLDCEVRRLVGDCVMPREGIFTRVITPGTIQAGDIITVIDKGEDQ
jgi:MOSC domain-containing protein YiiM